MPIVYHKNLFLATLPHRLKPVGLRPPYFNSDLGDTNTLVALKADKTVVQNINPSDLILQTRSSGYPKPTIFADTAGALFLRCYLNATDYYEISLNSAGAYVNKCIGGKIVFTNKFVTF